MMQSSLPAAEDGLNTTSSTSLDLGLPGVEPIQSGRYACIADNVFGEVKATLRLDVDGPPFIREMTSPRSFQAGSHSEWLHCPYGGFPIDKIAWDKDGKKWICLQSYRCPFQLSTGEGPRGMNEFENFCILRVATCKNYGYSN